MSRIFKKLDAEKSAELKMKKYSARPLDEEELKKVAGGSFGPSECPRCGGNVQEYWERIEGGPDAGRISVFIFCSSCGYEEWWGDY